MIERKRKTCAGCGGTYWTVQRDGTAYYHVCPPVLDTAALTAAAKTAKLSLANYARRHDTEAFTVRRHGHRDENPKRVKDGP